jgi:LAO/AO transport system kinase
MLHPRNPIDRSSLGRQLTRAANAPVADILAGFPAQPAHTAVRIGVTGPPGAGKSSLTARLCRRRLDAGRRLGVIAIDPTSPFTSGAILGDRIRMEEVSSHEQLFIRSLASRGAHNGLTDNLPEILLTLDCHDFDEVIVETVGVGQVECAVRDLVDTTVLVLNPESGDQVQAMKAGVLEAADIIVVNKADLPGAAKIAAEVQSVIRIRDHSENDWTPRVLMTSRHDEPGLENLDLALTEHLRWVRSRVDETARRRARLAYHLNTLVMRLSAERIRDFPPEWLDAGLSEAFKKLIESLS